MQQDLWKYSIVLGVALLFGWSTSYVPESALVAALAIIAWQIVQLRRLYLWLVNRKANPMQDSSGQIFLIHREIHRQNTKSARRKKQMSRLLKQFRRAIGALPDAIVLINESGKIEWANSNARSVLGIRWPEDAEVGFIDLIRYPEVDELMRNGGTTSQGVEINSLVNKGSTINLKCVNYTDSLRMVVARDVSRLLKVNQMHSDFVANVSHELKTPLTVLRGYLEIIEDGQDLPDKYRKPIAQMNLQSLRMQLIVNDLLYLAKLEDSENPVKQHEIDVTQLLNAIIESVQALIEEKHHKLELNINYDLRIRGAQTELHSAFANLITNAIHYTSEQGLIRIFWGLDGEQAVFSVKDNGLGIASQHIDRLTQRFYRVDTDRSREGGGTGLGLAIVKHVLQRHDAELQINSREGKGSEFRCVFPTRHMIGSEKQQQN